MEDLRALSVRAPWWWFILYAGKPIENRDWRTDHRGTVYLHASKWFNTFDVSCEFNDGAMMYQAAEKARFDSSSFAAPVSGQYMRNCGGCIVGKVDIVDCVSQSDSPWFVGKYGLVLRNPVAFETPVACKGALGLFRPPSEVLAACALAKVAA